MKINVKEWFATPKKALFTSACTVAGLTLLVAGTSFATGTIAESSSIGAENAQNFAFADAGVDPLSATAVRTEFDFEQGQFVYDVEFIASGTEYSYWIKASDGSVVKKELELIELPSIASDNNQTAETQEQPAEAAAQASSGQITLEDAKKKALDDAGVNASDATFTKTKTDYEHGVAVYDVEFYTSTHEYEYEIAAADGTVRKRSAEAFRTGAAASGGSSVSVSVDDAKNAALSHAGFSASDVTFAKAKLDEDDGILVYEIEFYRGVTEYDYTIDASSGAILEYDSEVDD
ncbi:MAG: PepSY domain-containing protein [Eubacteriales bacterium]|nr:PepSY domain-containing protein [Eubacteriales bacterium]